MLKIKKFFLTLQSIPYYPQRNRDATLICNALVKASTVDVAMFPPFWTPSVFHRHRTQTTNLDGQPSLQPLLFCHIADLGQSLLCPNLQSCIALKCQKTILIVTAWKYQQSCPNFSLYKTRLITHFLYIYNISYLYSTFCIFFIIFIWYIHNIYVKNSTKNYVNQCQTI